MSAANMMVVQYLYVKIANCEDVLLQSTLVKLVVASSSTLHCLIWALQGTPPKVTSTLHQRCLSCRSFTLRQSKDTDQPLPNKNKKK